MAIIAPRPSQPDVVLGLQPPKPVLHHQLDLTRPLRRPSASIVDGGQRRARHRVAAVGAPSPLTCGASMISARPVTAESGSPSAMPLAVQIRSGSMPSCSQANIAGAREAGLHLVGDEHHVVLAAPVQQCRQEAVGRDDEAALALDRFDDDRGQVVGAHLLVDDVDRALGGQLAVGGQFLAELGIAEQVGQRRAVDLRRTGRSRACASTSRSAPWSGWCGRGSGVVERHRLLAGVRPGDLDRVLHGLRTGIEQRRALSPLPGVSRLSASATAMYSSYGVIMKQVWVKSATCAHRVDDAGRGVADGGDGDARAGSMSRLPSTSSTMPPPARARRPASCCRCRATPRRPCGRSGPATADPGWRWRGSGSARGCSRLSPLARVRNTGCRVECRGLVADAVCASGNSSRNPCSAWIAWPSATFSRGFGGRGAVVGAPRRRQRRATRPPATAMARTGQLRGRADLPVWMPHARSTRRTVAAMDLVVFLPLLNGRVHVVRISAPEKSDASHHRPAQLAEDRGPGAPLACRPRSRASPTTPSTWRSRPAWSPPG